MYACMYACIYVHTHIKVSHLAGHLHNLGLLDGDGLLLHHGLRALNSTGDGLVDLAGHLDLTVLHHGLGDLQTGRGRREEEERGWRAGVATRQIPSQHRNTKKYLGR